MSQPASFPVLQPQTIRVAPGSAHDFALWQWAVSPIYDMDAATPDGRASYAIESEAYLYGEMTISAQRFTASRFDRTPRVIARAGLENVLVQVYQQGDFLFRAGGAERTARTGDIVLFDLTRPGLIQTSAASSLTVIVPRRLLAPLVTTLDGIHGRVIPAATPFNALLLAHICELQVQAPRLDLAARVAMSRATAALVAACTGIAAGGPDQAGTSVRGAVLHLIRQAIDEHLAEPALGPEFLARRFNLSRARLYRLFEPLGGVMNYIQQKRLMRVHQAISDPALFGVSIMTLAERFGFTEKTAFSRAFRALYGLSPSEARALARGGDREAGDRQAGAMDSFQEINRWLHGLDTPQAASSDTP